MTKSISASVGKNGVNKPNDVKVIQELLNGVSNIHGGPLVPLKVDGLCWGLTLGAIGLFQKTACGFLWPDQLISPGGKTWNQLIALTNLFGNIEIIGPPFWGVDTVAPAHLPFGGSPTLYDYVVTQSNGRAPAFFGRYLTPARAQQVTLEEMLYLGYRKCKILLCYNQLSSTSVSGNYSAGVVHANRAADSASRIAVPQSRSIWIYVNIDSGVGFSYIPNPAWLAGWWDGLWLRGYGPGIYYTASTTSTLVKRSFDHCKEVKDVGLISIWTNYGSSRNCKSEGQLRIPIQFSPPQPIVGSVDVWQYTHACFNNVVDLDISSQRGYDRMWNVGSTVGFM